MLCIYPFIFPLWFFIFAIWAVILYHFSSTEEYFEGFLTMYFLEANYFSFDWSENFFKYSYFKDTFIGYRIQDEEVFFKHFNVVNLLSLTFILVTLYIM